MILITPKREGLVLGDFDVETSLLFVLVVFERAEDELELKLAVVVPLRTIVVGVKEELLELFCTEIDLVWDRRNQYCWRKCVSMKIVPVHGECIYRKGLIVQNLGCIKCKFVIEMCHKQIQTGIAEHLEN